MINFFFGLSFAISQGNSLMEWAKNPDLRRQQEEEDDERKEKEAEKEDHESLQKAREWDEFKDG